MVQHDIGIQFLKNLLKYPHIYFFKKAMCFHVYVTSFNIVNEFLKSWKYENSKLE